MIYIQLSYASVYIHVSGVFGQNNKVRHIIQKSKHAICDIQFYL